jgi:hypothetical protein
MLAALTTLLIGWLAVAVIGSLAAGPFWLTLVGLVGVLLTGALMLGRRPRAAHGHPAPRKGRLPAAA